MITEKYKGKDHPSLATHYINLATSYSFSKNYAEAERLLRISLRVMLKSVSPDDPSITFPMLHLAVTLFNLRRDKEAERLAIEVLRIREAAYGEESLPVGKFSSLHLDYKVANVLLSSDSLVDDMTISYLSCSSSFVLPLK